MSVFVVTGAPGSGKTAYVVDRLHTDEQFKGRPLFVMGIPDLAIDHTPCPPVDQWTEYRQSPEDPSLELPYFRFPENAVLVIDECQRVFRPRPVGSKVPPEVQAFETHRHTGIDIILITQHAGLIDSNIRKLNPRHVHIRVTALGRYKYEWPELGDPESSSSRELAVREKYKLPARSFGLYKSSELHTKIKVRLPWFVYLFVACFLGAVGLGYYGYQRVKARVEPSPIASPLDDVNRPGSKPPVAPDGAVVKTSADYLTERMPRVHGLAYTAPVYDSLTVPTDAPFPTGCVLIAPWRDRPERCKCTDQQGTDMQVAGDMCRQIVAHGHFKDWGEQRRTGDVAQPRRGADAVPPASNTSPVTPGQPVFTPEQPQAGAGPSPAPGQNQA